MRDPAIICEIDCEYSEGDRLWVKKSTDLPTRGPRLEVWIDNKDLEEGSPFVVIGTEQAERLAAHLQGWASRIRREVLR